MKPLIAFARFEKEKAASEPAIAANSQRQPITREEHGFRVLQTRFTSLQSKKEAPNVCPYQTYCQQNCSSLARCFLDRDKWIRCTTISSNNFQTTERPSVSKRFARRPGQVCVARVSRSQLESIDRHEQPAQPF